MKQTLTKLFSPILEPFESGDEPFVYKASHRSILLAVGSLFFLLALSTILAGIYFKELGAFFPGLIFLCVALVCLVVGFLGSPRAVAKIWGSK